MKTLFILLILSFLSCKKAEDFCYECVKKSDGVTKVPDVCGSKEYVSGYSHEWKLVCRKK